MDAADDYLETNAGVASSDVTYPLSQPDTDAYYEDMENATAGVADGSTEGNDVFGELLDAVGPDGLDIAAESAGDLAGTCVATAGLGCAAAAGLALGGGIDYLLGDFNSPQDASTASAGAGGNDGAQATMAAARWWSPETSCSNGEAQVSLDPQGPPGSNSWNNGYAGNGISAFTGGLEVPCGAYGGGLYVQVFEFPTGPNASNQSQGWYSNWVFNSPGGNCSGSAYGWGDTFPGPMDPGAVTYAGLPYGQVVNVSADPIPAHGFAAYWQDASGNGNQCGNVPTMGGSPAGNGLYVGVAVERGSAVSVSGPKTSCPSGDTCTPVADNPPASWNTGAGTLGQLCSDPAYADLCGFLGSSIGATAPDGTPEAPPGSVEVPDCTGETASGCQSTLTADGFTSAATTSTLTDAEANLSEPAGAVVAQEPAAGRAVGANTVVELELNPSPLPLVIPAPLQGETFPAYQSRLQGLGFVGTISSNVLSDANESPTAGPNAAVSTDPAAGSQVAPSTSITVETNPSDAPAATGGSAPADPTAPTAPGISIPSAPTPCSVFPFGIPCWIGNQLSSLEASPVAPSWSLTIPSALGGGQWDINLGGSIFGANLGSIMAIVRPVLLALSFLGLIYWIAGMALGGATSGGGSAGEDEG